MDPTREEKAGQKPGRRPGSRESAAQWTAEELIRRCLSHEEAAWIEFLRRYARLIYATVHRVDLPVTEREEAFQASVAAIYEELRGLRDPRKIVSWIVGISWRQAINRIRRRPREVPLPAAPLEESIHSRIFPGGDPLPDEELLQLERAQQAHQALEALSPRCRRLLKHLFYDDPQPSYLEIAREERIPIGSLGPTRARCLSQMRRYFETQGWI